MYTLAEAKEKLRMWLVAEEAIAVAGQEYEINNGRKLTRADIREVGKRIDYWKRQVAILEGKTRRSFRAIPRDV